MQESSQFQSDRESPLAQPVFPIGDAVFDEAARRVRAIAGDCAVAVSAYDAEKDCLCLRGVQGCNPMLESVMRLAGGSVSDWSGRLTDSARRYMLTGRLHRVPLGFYDLFMHQIPMGLSSWAQRLCGITDVYAIGILHGSSLLGCISIGMKGADATLDEEAIERYCCALAGELATRNLQEFARVPGIEMRQWA